MSALENAQMYLRDKSNSAPFCLTLTWLDETAAAARAVAFLTSSPQAQARLAEIAGELEAVKEKAMRLGWEAYDVGMAA